MRTPIAMFVPFDPWPTTTRHHRPATIEQLARRLQPLLRDARRRRGLVRRRRLLRPLPPVLAVPGAGAGGVRQPAAGDRRGNATDRRGRCASCRPRPGSSWSTRRCSAVTTRSPAAVVLCEVRDGRITEVVGYCNGGWDDDAARPPRAPRRRCCGRGRRSDDARVDDRTMTAADVAGGGPIAGAVDRARAPPRSRPPGDSPSTCSTSSSAAGAFRLLLPPSHGGIGADLADAMRVFEALAAVPTRRRRGP